MSAQTKTSRDESRNGSGAISIARTTLKIAVLAPMPSASVTMATAAKPGDRRSPRHAKRTSFMLAPLADLRRFPPAGYQPNHEATKDTKFTRFTKSKQQEEIRRFLFRVFRVHLFFVFVFFVARASAP